MRCIKISKMVYALPQYAPETPSLSQGKSRLPTVLCHQEIKVGLTLLILQDMETYRRLIVCGMHSCSEGNSLSG